MTLPRRFLYYFIGIGLGLLFVYAVVLRGRDWPAWFPQGIVIENTLKYPMVIKASGDCAPGHFNIDSIQLRQLIKDASVDFKASNVHGKPCKTYLFNTTYQEKDFQMEFDLCDSLVQLNWIGYKGSIANCK